MNMGIEFSNKKRFPIHTGVIQAHFNSGRELIDQMMNKSPSSINLVDETGRTALHWAIYNQHKEIALYILQNANPDTSIEDSKGATAFSFLTSPGYPQTVAEEIEAGTPKVEISKKKKRRSRSVNDSSLLKMISSLKISKIRSLIDEGVSATTFNNITIIIIVIIIIIIINNSDIAVAMMMMIS